MSRLFLPGDVGKDMHLQSAICYIRRLHSRAYHPEPCVTAVNGGVKELGTGRGVWHVIGLGASVTVGGFCAG